MAARTRKIFHDEETRARIKASQIVNRLQKHIDGKVELKTTQVTAALGLLRKSLPDLANVELTGKDGGDLMLPAINVVITHKKDE